VRGSNRIGHLGLVAVSALVLAAQSAATTVYKDTLAGTEVLPVSSTLGTFVGVATGALPATWRVQIAHQPLAAGPTVLITGGTVSLLTLTGRRISGPVTDGSVTVTNRGSRCTDQTYRVVVTFSSGSFDGTLTHHRRSIFGRCILYSATIRGHGTFNA
jgi:hypothetical protein